MDYADHDASHDGNKVIFVLTAYFARYLVFQAKPSTNVSYITLVCMSYRFQKYFVISETLFQSVRLSTNASQAMATRTSEYAKSCPTTISKSRADMSSFINVFFYSEKLSGTTIG